MNTRAITITALQSLGRHKVRSLLTTLGIIIGIVAIIAVMSIGEGAKFKVSQTIQKLGTNFIIVLSAPQKKLAIPGRGFAPSLKPGDLETIKRECDDIALISPGRILGKTITYMNEKWPTQIAGVAGPYPTIRNFSYKHGTFFTEEDVRTRAKVAVLGKTVAQELFGDANPIDERIRIGKMPFKVVGVLGELGKRPDGTDQDDIVFIPISTMIRRLLTGVERYNALIISAKTTESMPRISSQIRSILRQRRNLKEDDDDDFTIFSQSDIVEASSAAAQVLNLLLMIIASISLLVGGIGIMNIMLVTVTERTREIGLRMAVGATTANIRNQFLLEAVIICLLGGLLGILLGILIAHIVSAVLGWPIFISYKAILLSLSASGAIGIFFGYYPAHQASLLNPIEALVER